MSAHMEQILAPYGNDPLAMSLPEYVTAYATSLRGMSAYTLTIIHDDRRDLDGADVVALTAVMHAAADAANAVDRMREAMDNADHVADTRGERSE